MISTLLAVYFWIYLHVTKWYAHAATYFFSFGIIYWFPNMEDMNLVFFSTKRLPPSKTHFTPLPSLKHCVILLVRSIFSIYTNMVKKISTDDLSSIMISITFPSLHNFLFSLELVISLRFASFNCLVFYALITDLYQKIYPNCLKLLSIVPTYQVF